MTFKLFSVQEDGSKILLGEFESEDDAMAAINVGDPSLTYSIESFNGFDYDILF